MAKEYIVKGESLTALADKIRVLSGTTGTMGLDDMTIHVGEANENVNTEASLISQITLALDAKAAASEPILQTKTVTPTTSSQNVIPDSGYDGLSKVTVEGDSNLKAENIAEGVSIFGVTGTHSGGGGASVDTCTVNITKTVVGASYLCYTAVGDDGKLCTIGELKTPREITVECVKGCGFSVTWRQSAFGSVESFVCDGNASILNAQYTTSTAPGFVVIDIPNNALDTVNITMNCTMNMDT